MGDASVPPPPVHKGLLDDLPPALEDAQLQQPAGLGEKDLRGGQAVGRLDGSRRVWERRTYGAVEQLGG